MNPKMFNSEPIVMELQQYCVDFLIDEDFVNMPRVTQHWLFETATDALRMDVKLAGRVLQRDAVLARHPATVWSLFLHLVGLKRWATYKTVRVTEIALFPQLKVPQEWKVGARLDFQTVSSLESYRG
jgi:hypothetical protein